MQHDQPQCSLLSRLTQALIDINPTPNLEFRRQISGEVIQLPEDYQSENIDYFNLSLNEKIKCELESIGISIPYSRNLDKEQNPTPEDFIKFLNSLRGKNLRDFNNLKQLISDESIKNTCPYSCIHSNINKKNANFSYIKFVCRFHTKKLGECPACFKINFENQVISSIDFIESNHNHKLDKLFIGSKFSLLTSNEIQEIRKEASMGMPSSLIRRFNANDILPNQLYDIIRNSKNKSFENPIQKLYDYTQTLKNDYDIIWKDDENNKFQSLLIVNSIIKNYPYSKDIVMIDDTACTNNFNYFFIPFLVFDENNKLQMLAIGIIINKEEKSFCDILQSLKLTIDHIRVFILDRLQSQISAIKKIYPGSYLVYCYLHISRNIKEKMGRNSGILNLFWKFINKKISEEEYKNELKNEIQRTGSKHLQNLLDDIDHYSPYQLKHLRIRKHSTTNAIEGGFGNIKKWTDHKLLPLDEVLSLFINESRLLMKNHINLKYNQLDSKIYNGRKLGIYAINKIQKRVQKSKDLIVALSNSNKEISANARMKLEFCNCPKNDLPCIHIIYKRLLNASNSESIINEEEIPLIYFFNDLIKSEPDLNQRIIVKNDSEENWDYSTTLERFKFWADAAQRSEPVRDLLREFFKQGDKLKKTLDPMAKDVLLIPGAQPTVPSANVCKHLFKRKRSPCCSNCHKKGHYASTCPFNQNN